VVMAWLGGVYGGLAGDSSTSVVLQGGEGKREVDEGRAVADLP